MDSDKDNANPTILNASDLPSRRPNSVVRPREDGGTGLFDGLLPQSRYMSDPRDSDSSSSEDEANDVEAIDAQEIYGTSCQVYEKLHSCSWI